MTKFFEGKKTYIGLVVALIGVFGLGSYISPTEATELVNNLFAITGIIVAIYGRIATKK